MFPFIGAIISGVVGLGKEYLGNKRKKSEQKSRITEAKIQAVEKQEANEEAWNRIKAEEGKASWKDEYWTIVLSVPAILAFVPGMSEYVLEGFKVLESMPEWYRYALGVAIAAAFGVRQLAKKM